MQTVSRRVSSIFITTPLLLMACLLMIAALYYRNRDLSIVVLLILSIGGAARVWTMFGHNGIGITAGVDKKRAFPGHVLDFNLTLTNGTYLPLWCQAIIPLNGLTHHDRQGGGTDMAGQTSLLWHDVSRFAWKLVAPGRGIFRPGPISLTSGDLFGFFPRERTVHAPVEIIVYPRLVPLRSFSVIRRDFFGIPGDESPVRDPVYILGTHDYQFGRPARFIHWKASARRRILQEKVFEPTEQEKIFFVVLVEGFEKEQASAEFERMLEAVASIAALLDEKGIAAGLATDAAMNGKGAFYRSVRKDPGHLSSILEMLARMRMEKGRDVLEGLRGGTGMPFGVTCICFSYEAGDASRSVREYFRRRRIPVIDYVCRMPRREGGNAPGPGAATRALCDLLVDENKGAA